MSNLSSKQTRVLASALARNVNQQNQASTKRLSTRATLSAPIAPVWWGGDPAFAGLVPRDEQEKDCRSTSPSGLKAQARVSPTTFSSSGNCQPRRRGRVPSP
jgi:hypothetical protein